MAAPISVIGTQYCAPRGMELAIVKKAMSFADNFKVTYVNGKLIFKVKQSLWSLHGHRVLVNTTSKRIVTLRGKMKQTSESEKHFNVKVNQNMDYAFIVAVIVILDEINDNAKKAVEVLRHMFKEY